jgi:hypothetical protein
MVRAAPLRAVQPRGARLRLHPQTAHRRCAALAGLLIARLADSAERRFASAAAWAAHLQRLGIAGFDGSLAPARVATEGALWGSIAAHGMLGDAVIVSDDAGQFDAGSHALCRVPARVPSALARWGPAERLVHRLDTVTDAQRAAQQHLRALIWWFYADLKAYREAPSARRRSELRARFERIFRRRGGFVMLDRLLARLHARKAELLRVAQQRLSAITILHVGGVHDHGEQQADGVPPCGRCLRPDQQMALAADHRLARVVAGRVDAGPPLMSALSSVGRTWPRRSPLAEDGAGEVVGPA